MWGSGGVAPRKKRRAPTNGVLWLRRFVAVVVMNAVSHGAAFAPSPWQMKIDERGPSGRRAPESPRRGSRDPNRYRHAQHHTQLRKDDSTQVVTYLPIWEQVLPDSDVLATRLMAPRTQLGAKICVSIQQIASGLAPDPLSGLKVPDIRIFSYFCSHIICLGAPR